MNRRAVLIAAVVAVLVLALWWFLLAAGSDDNAETKSTAHVTLAQLRVEPIAQKVEAFGVVASAPGTDQVVAAPYDCVVGAVLVESGAAVAAGDVLLQIAPSPETQLQLQAARSALVVAKKGLAASQARFDLKLATNQELALAHQAEADARTKVASLESRGLGGDGKIRASVAGVVSKLEVTRGSLVALGTPLVDVATAQGLEARLELEVGNRRLLSRGQPVTLISTDSPDPQPVAAYVRTVGAALNPVSGSFEVRVPVPMKSQLLLGEHVQGLIEVKKDMAALVVARSAVLPEDGKQVLYTVKAGKAVRHEVTLGIASGEQSQVLGSGLMAGDAVVVTGNYELSDGMDVQAEPATSTQDQAGAGTEP